MAVWNGSLEAPGGGFYSVFRGSQQRGRGGLQARPRRVAVGQEGPAPFPRSCRSHRGEAAVLPAEAAAAAVRSGKRQNRPAVVCRCLGVLGGGARLAVSVRHEEAGRLVPPVKQEDQQQVPHLVTGAQVVELTCSRKQVSLVTVTCGPSAFRTAAC